MKLVTQEDLERELDQEKNRFMNASRRAADAIKRDLNVVNWVKQYPMESAIAIIGLGFAAGYFIQHQRHGREKARAPKLMPGLE
jgi:hypothetical protein